ncbi:MAG: hypothetical protein AB1607_01695 [Chloroflexota bacterium]
MITRLIPTFSLLLLLVVSCTPQATQPVAAPPAAELPSATPFQPVESAGGEVTQPPVAVEAPTQAALPVATSRGPDLHATDPRTVSLASGQYQFVEFFRFT